MPSIGTPKDPFVPVLVRFPRDVLRKVKTAAKKSGRSRNSEIVHRLAESLQSNGSSVAAAATVS